MLENLGFILLGVALGIGGLVLWQAVDSWRNAAGPKDSADWINQEMHYQNVKKSLEIRRDLERVVKEADYDRLKEEW